MNNLHELIIVVFSTEEWLTTEDECCKYASKGPEIETVVIILNVNEELRALEVARSDTDVVLHAGMIKLCKAPVDELQLASGGVDHDVMWLNIAMHDSIHVAEVQSAQQLEHVVPNVIIREGGIKLAEIDVVHIFLNEARSLCGRFAYDVK